MKYKVEATIPTTQYGNLRPTFEISELQQEDEVFETLTRLWSRFGESPLKDKKVGGGVKVVTFTGETVMWNEDKHIYTDLKGNVLLSGSKYAAQHSPKFPKDVILPKTAAKWGVPEKIIDEIWGAKGYVSLDFGNAIHKALELYHNYHQVGEQIKEVSEVDDNYALHKQPFLNAIVKDFVDKFGADAMSEVIVSDSASGMAGTIDRLAIIDEEKKVCRVGDYKSNAELKKPKKLEYQKQLSFYSHILINKGWTVEGLDLYYLDKEGKWVKEEMEVLDLE